MTPPIESLLPPHLRVRGLVCDVDGVLTEGGLALDSQDETKIFNTRDGQGIKYFQRAGGQTAILTGRRSRLVERRAEELGIEIVVQDAKIKLPRLHEIAEQMKIPLEEICYIGDDMPDLPCIRAVGLGVAVADAAEPLLREAQCVTRARGGQGAVREVVEWILKSQGRWDSLMGRYYDGQIQ